MLRESLSKQTMKRMVNYFGFDIFSSTSRYPWRDDMTWTLTLTTFCNFFLFFYWYFILLIFFPATNFEFCNSVENGERHVIDKQLSLNNDLLEDSKRLHSIQLPQHRRWSEHRNLNLVWLLSLNIYIFLFCVIVLSSTNSSCLIHRSPFARSLFIIE